MRSVGLTIGNAPIARVVSSVAPGRVSCWSTESACRMMSTSLCGESPFGLWNTTTVPVVTGMPNVFSDCSWAAIAGVCLGARSPSSVPVAGWGSRTRVAATAPSHSSTTSQRSRSTTHT